jgi:5-(hydroxymethyl)furfural/furfural oxidase
VCVYTQGIPRSRYLKRGRDVQVWADDDAKVRAKIGTVLNKSSWHGIGLSIGALGTVLTKPFSRGTVKLDPSDPTAEPIVDFAFLEDPRDARRLAKGLGLAVDLMRDPGVEAVRNEMFAQGYSEVVRKLNTPGMVNTVVASFLATVLDGPEWLRKGVLRYVMQVGDTDEALLASDEWLVEAAGSRSFGTFHPSCTCKMGGQGDSLAVVDSRCDVRGVRGLSVVDASVMPSIVRSNTNIPTLMIAERYTAMRNGAAV